VIAPQEPILELLQEKVSQLLGFGPETHKEARWIQWHQEMRSILRNAFGEDSAESKAYSQLTRWFPIAGSNEQIQAETQKQWAQIVEGARGFLEALILQVQRFGVPQGMANSSDSIIRPKVFIAHGSESRALALLVDFLTSMGCEPVIAEKMPSEDRSVNENVEYWMGKSDCAVVLATGEELAGDQVVARPNVHIEIGRFQERFAGRIVYLLEDGAGFPSNITEKVRERFSQENMTKAFIKIANEFRAFGLIKARA
jgi:predicted nucleotide-binding protein